MNIPLKYPNRNEMIASLITPGAIGAEIGVFEGNFSQVILDKCNPSKLYLCDTWAGLVQSGDVNGHDLRTLDGDTLFNSVSSRFYSDPRVSIYRMDSQFFLNGLSPVSLDFVYIDADHREDAAYRDLEAALRVVKTGGWIMGHDFIYNDGVPHVKWPTGVPSAVSRFCSMYNLTVDAIALDGLTSFAIKVR